MTRVHLVRLKVYGFAHPGRERWRARVIKRPWRVIPGSTLYGALTTALIKLDCDKQSLEENDTQRAYELHQQHGCGYGKLLALLTDEKPNIRFSPLVPVAPFQPGSPNWGTVHNRLAAQLAPTAQPAPATGADLLTEPHAPINRSRMTIHGDQLYGVTGHQPFLDYAGFIVERPQEGIDAVAELKRAFRALPVMPFGGRGKFCTAEGQIVGQPLTESEFLDPFQQAVSATSVPVRLLTPMILGNNDWLLDDHNTTEQMIPRMQLYRAWRQGLYRAGGELTMFPRPKENGKPNDEIISDSRHQAGATLGVPEDSRFKVRLDGGRRDSFWEQFLWGFGNHDWTYLGWGQVSIDG